jgi:hypothetical protein
MSMEDSSHEEEFRCEKCDAEVGEDAEFCPACGALFMEGVVCKEHPSVGAEGVCVICDTPCCGECGAEKASPFLCNAHSEYEVMEGMARVYGTADTLQAHYIAKCLEQAGLAPFVYSRRFNPGPDVAQNFLFPQVRGETLSELKVCVPFDEVTAAEALLKDLLLGAPGGLSDR